MKILILLSLFMLSGCFSSNEPKDALKEFKDIKLVTDKEKVIYSMGFILGGNLNRAHLDDNELKFLIAGIRDQLILKNPRIDISQYKTEIQKMLGSRKKRLEIENQAKNQKYIIEFQKKWGDVQVSPSGIVYRIIVPGGPPDEGLPSNVHSIMPNNKVDLQYRLALVDGTVLESTYSTNRPKSFVIKDLIKGLREALILIGVKGKIKMVIPPNLAYGAVGKPPKIPPSAALVYEMEIVGYHIKPKIR